MQPTSQPRIISSGYTTAAPVTRPAVVSSISAAPVIRSVAGPTVTTVPKTTGTPVVRSIAPSSPTVTSSGAYTVSSGATYITPASSRTTTIPTSSSTAAMPATVINAGPARVIQSPVTSPTTISSGGYVSSGVKVIGSSVPTSSGPIVYRSAAPITEGSQFQPTYKQNVISGPGLTQGAYEAKHENDPQLNNLKDLRKTSGLREIPVSIGLATMKQAGGEDGKLSREDFLKVYEGILIQHQVELPSDATRNAVFDLFDRDDNGVVDLMELICGISLLCSGSEDDKIHAVFDIFDENGDGFISMDEMYKFLTSVFKVVLTPNVMGVMNSMGVQVDSAEDLASVTALECFKTADLNQDGKLSVAEFKNWFYAPRNDPSFLFSPVRKLLS